MGIIQWLRSDPENEARHERHERRLNSLDLALKAVGTSTIARLDRIEKDQKDHSEKRATEFARVEEKIDAVVSKLAKQDGLVALALRVGNWGYRLLVAITCLAVVLLLSFVAWKHPDLLPKLIEIVAAAAK